jgi:hypothetical protein
MTISAPENDLNPAKGFSRRSLVKTAAWSVPVIAVAVATPLAAASTSLASLTYEVTPLVDIDAPYGAVSVRISNTGTIDFAGPLTLTTPSWASIAPFSITGAIASSAGGNDVWTIPAGAVPAGQSLVLDLSWAGPYPLTAEQQPLTVSVDPLIGTATPSGPAAIASPYQLLWFAATPGGEGNVAGTPSFFIANTTETPLDATGEIRIGVWTFPRQSVMPISSGGTTYPGQRVAENGTFTGRYQAVDLDVPARTGRQIFTVNWSILAGTQPVPQQNRQLQSIVSTTQAATFTPLGSVTLYSSYRP